MLAGIFQMLLCSAILYGYYYLFLRNERFHQYNRFYLLGSVIISLILPLLKIPVIISEDDGIIYQSLDSLNTTVTVVATQQPVITASALLSFLCIILAIFFIIRIIVALYKIVKLKKQNPSQPLGDITLITTSHPSAPFSFFKWLFWNNAIEPESVRGKYVFQHEMYHIKKHHSLDLVFTEVICALFWFNPVFHFIRKEIKIIQEFLADRHASSNTPAGDYAETLLMQHLAANINY